MGFFAATDLTDFLSGAALVTLLVTATFGSLDFVSSCLALFDFVDLGMIFLDFLALSRGCLEEAVALADRHLVGTTSFKLSRESALLTFPDFVLLVILGLGFSASLIFLFIWSILILRATIFLLLLSFDFLIVFLAATFLILLDF